VGILIGVGGALFIGRVLSSLLFRGDRDGPCDICSRHVAALPSYPGRVLHPGAPRDACRSDGRTEIRIDSFYPLPGNGTPENLEEPFRRCRRKLCGRSRRRGHVRRARFGCRWLCGRDSSGAYRGGAELVPNDLRHGGAEDFDGVQHFFVWQRRDTHLECDAGDAPRTSFT